jgi:hypothetical protein
VLNTLQFKNPQKIGESVEAAEAIINSEGKVKERSARGEGKRGRSKEGRKGGRKERGRGRVGGSDLGQPFLCWQYITKKTIFKI